MPNTIQLVIELDDKGSAKISTVKAKIDELDKSVDSSSKGPLKAFQEGWGFLAIKITAATATIYSVIKTLSAFIDEAAEAEQIENRLRFALETTGYSWQYAKLAVDEFAKSIQDNTRFSDEQARQSLTDMMMYTRDFGKAQMGAKLAMDMSIRTGQDLGSTSRLIGMAMSGNIEMLGRYIPELRNLDERLGSNASAAQKAEYALKILQEKFGGTAQADLKSYSGQVAQFKNAWSDLKEEIGTHLLPILEKTFEHLTKIIKMTTAAGESTAEYRKRIAEEWYGFPTEAPGAAPAPSETRFTEAFKAQRLAAEMQKDILAGADLKEQEEILKALIEEYAKIDEFNTKWIEAEEKKGEEIRDLTLETLIGDYAKIDEENQKWIVDWGIGGEKIRELDAEFAKVVAEAERLSELGQMPDWRESIERIIPKLKTNVSEMQTIWNSLGQNISDAWATNMTRMIRGAESVGDAFKNIAGSMADTFISAVMKMIVEWLLFEKVAGGEKKFLGGGSGIGSIFSWIGSLFAEGGRIQGWKPLAEIPRFQYGGRFDRPTLGIIAEGGESEWVIPESKMGKFRSGGGGDTYIVQNYVQVTDPNTFIKIYGGVVKRLSEESVMEAKRFNKLSSRG